ncbi:unnamed protein product [Caenorhabditis angaria]|uniref:Prenyltransferase alpha-alpha toroid domain-containing protein n=1 Tax=Caenorhabditis angaria TaxID=860376 RepID=A0A9P1I921_9PELO|nr:unnamed protein product [Caenorhabditis angaria]
MGDYLTESELFKRARQAIENDEPQKLTIDKHVAFLIRHLNVFPEAYNSLDSNQITLLYFALSGLDLLGELDSLLSPTRRQEYIDWIYRLQFTKG